MPHHLPAKKDATPGGRIRSNLWAVLKHGTRCRLTRTCVGVGGLNQARGRLLDRLASWLACAEFYEDADEYAFAVPNRWNVGTGGDLVITRFAEHVKLVFSRLRPRTKCLERWPSGTPRSFFFFGRQNKQGTFPSRVQSPVGKFLENTIACIPLCCKVHTAASAKPHCCDKITSSYLRQPSRCCWCLQPGFSQFFSLAERCQTRLR